MINLRNLRRVLERCVEWEERASVNDRYIKSKSASNRIIIKRKKKIVLEETSNGSVKSKRRNVIKIEIIE